MFTGCAAMYKSIIQTLEKKDHRCRKESGKAGKPKGETGQPVSIELEA